MALLHSQKKFLEHAMIISHFNYSYQQTIKERVIRTLLVGVVKL